MIGKFLRAFGPIAALAAGTMIGGCSDNFSVRVGDDEGVPLAQLDQSGPAPTKLVLAGPDKVVVSDGAKLAIEVSGDPDAVAALRFTIAKDGTLGVTRKDGEWSDIGQATVKVTMPAPQAITVAGSGSVATEAVGAEPSLTIAGSGSLSAPRIAAKSLEMTIAGSGSLEAAGTADKLELTIAGSGDAAMEGLKVDRADLTIAGSGDAVFASDGKVDASIMGAGSVTVIGRATCKVNAIGSGTLRCRTTQAAADAPTPPAPPAGPAAPKGPTPPKAPTAPKAP